MDHLKLENIDTSGAIRETAEAAGANRAEFLRKGALGGAGLVAGGTLFSSLLAPAEAAISTKKKSLANDIKIGNYALTLEYLEAAFYAAAIKNNAFSSEAYKTFATQTGAHETAHVAALKKILGSKAVKQPTFDFGPAVTDAAMFAQTAQVLEDTGVAAYAGQGPNLKTRAIVVAALSIHSVEARHAAWIRFLNTNGAGDPGKLPAPAAFDKAAGEKATLAKVTGTGFIKG
jgi:hypothetical protein